MSANRDKTGRWFVSYWQGGRAHKQYFGRGPQAERLARARDFQLKRERALGRRNSPREGLTFRQMAAIYLEQRGHSEDTGRALAQLYPVFGDKPCSRLSLRDLIEAVVPMTCSPARKNRLAAYARANLGHGVKAGYLLENPFAGWRALRESERPKHLPTREELDAILAASPEHLRRALLVALYTALRPGNSELFTLRWSDIDWERRRMVVLQGKTGRVKSVAIPPVLMKHLLAWRVEGEYVLTYKGKPFKSLKRAWHTVLSKAGITRPLRLYDCRHWCITIMLSEGADPKAASAQAGHSSTKLTLDLYYGLIPGLQEQAAALLPDLWPVPNSVPEVKNGAKTRCLH